MNRLDCYKFSSLYDMSSGISSSKEQAGHGAPFVSFRDVYSNYFLPEELDQLMDTTEKEQERYSVRQGDIFLTRTSETLDELAMSAVAIKDYPHATFSGFTKRLRPRNLEFPYPKYMAFYLRSPYFRKVIESVTTMTTRASFNDTLFGFLELRLPDIEQQRAIGDLLYSVDKAIQINNQINDNLQATTFDFYMHRFFGKKPNGKLSDILIEHPKSKIQVSDAKDAEGDYPFFTSGDAVLEWPEYLVDGRCMLLNTGGNADVKFYVGKMAYSTDAWSVSAKDGLSDYLYMLLFSIRQELNQKFFLGTGLKHLQKPLLKDRPIYIPDSGERDSFNEVAVRALTVISANQRENHKLQELRDWLLPMLMNGQATVRPQQANYRLSDD